MSAAYNIANFISFWRQILFCSVAGRYRRDDPDFLRLVELNDQFMAYAAAGNPVDILPWTRAFLKRYAAVCLCLFVCILLACLPASLSLPACLSFSMNSLSWTRSILNRCAVVCLYACPSVPVCLPACLSARLNFWTACSGLAASLVGVQQSVCLSVCLLACLCVCMPVCNSTDRFP